MKNLAVLVLIVCMIATRGPGLIAAAPDLHTLDFGNGQTLTIENVNVSSLQSSDFILHH